jgi:hypothetical protein
VILHREFDHPFDPPVVRFAIFIAGSAPISRTESVGWDVTSAYHDVDLKDYLGAHGAVGPQDDKFYTAGINFNQIVDKKQPGRKVCCWLSQVNKERIQIPTTHVMGEKDGWLRESKVLYDMCDPELRNMFQHNRGHEIPLRPEINQEMANIIKIAIMKRELIA